MFPTNRSLLYFRDPTHLDALFIMDSGTWMAQIKLTFIQKCMNGRLDNNSRKTVTQAGRKHRHLDRQTLGESDIAKT